MIYKIINSTNHQKILNFLVSNLGESYYDRQISRLTGVSRAGANFALRDLVKAGLAQRQKQGRMYFYSVSGRDAVIKQFKVLQNVIYIQSLVCKLKPFCLKLTLYGSCAAGENTRKSDIDILVVAANKENKENIKDVIFNTKGALKEKLKPIIVTPNELVKLKKESPVFYEETLKGIALWERKEI